MDNGVLLPNSRGACLVEQSDSEAIASRFECKHEL